MIFDELIWSPEQFRLQQDMLNLLITGQCLIFVKDPQLTFDFKEQNND